MNKSKDHKYLKREFLENQNLLILSVTKRCNLCCKYCRTKDRWYDVLGQKSEKLDLNKSDWPKLLNIVRKENIGEVLITGGEPAEYPLLEEFFLFLDKNKIRFSIHTNGVSKNWNDIFSILKKKKLSPDIHLSTELLLDFQKELRGGSDLPLEFISNAKKLGLLVELKVNLHQKLLSYKNSLKDNLYFWIDKGVDSFFFQPIAPISEDFSMELELKKSFIPFLSELKRLKLKDAILKEKIRNSEQGINVMISLLKGTGLYKKVARKCDSCDKIIFISSDLKISNCKTLWGREKGKSCDELFDFICCGFQP